jgi:hypothetical protein
MGNRPIAEVRKDIEALQKDLGIEVKFKDEWWVMKAMNLVVGLFNRQFMTRYTTTFGDTVAFPTRSMIHAPEGSDEATKRKADTKYVRVMIHEMVHILDHRKYKAIPYSWLYTCPQIMALLALGAFGAFWNIEYLWFLLCLGFLLPWPAPGRVWAEKRGYTMTMAFYKWQFGTVLMADPDWIEEHFDWIVNNFTGWGYYKMSWSKKKILNMLSWQILRINNGVPLDRQISIAPRLREIFTGSKEEPRPQAQAKPEFEGDSNN